MKLQYGIPVGLFIIFLSVYPQIYLWSQRGSEYNGATFYYDYDEPFYAAYLQALIDGRPRKNSVYQGGEEPQEHETILSVQLLAPAAAALTAKVFGLSSEGAFLMLSIVFALLSALAVYWLLHRLTDNPLLAAAGALFILIFGPNAAGISILKETFGFGASAFYLTFLRRYTPAMAFPFVFLLIGFVWSGIRSVTPRATYYSGVFTVLCFAALVYSYFFFWTGMLAWMVCLAALQFFLFPGRRSAAFWTIVFSGAIVVLIPYFLLLADRQPTTDAAQVLEHTRRFVLFRPTLILGLPALLVTLICTRMGRLPLRDHTSLFIISFTALPLAVFNQQIVTGYSLQSMHYNMYLLNYLVLLGGVLLIHRLFRERLDRAKPFFLLIPAALCCIWGMVETHYTTTNRYFYNVRRDEALPVNRYLAERARTDPAAAKKLITMNFDPVQADNQPAIAPHGVLWGEHLGFSNLSPAAYRSRFFLYLYLQNKDNEWLRRRLQSCPNEACRALIGWRVNPTLSYDLSRIEAAEIESLVNEYGDFRQNLSPEKIYDPPVSFAIVSATDPVDFTIVDKWYVREKGERVGNYTVYPLTRK